MKGKFSGLIKGSNPVLVDFFATWCGPCKTQAPILQQVASQVSDKVRIIKIDVDKNQGLASQYNIRSVPTLVLFKNGKEVWRKPGVSQAQELISLLNKYS